MEFDFVNSKSHICLNRKRCFSILLLVNCILAFLYYTYVQNQSEGTKGNSNSAKGIRINFNPDRNSTKPSKPIEYIRTILENEYNYDDLVKFYSLNEKEFSLGLRCTRKPKRIETTTKVNYTGDTTIEDNSTTISSLPIAATSQVDSLSALPYYRYQRRSLFTFVIDHADACLNDSIDLLILIISKSDNYKTRDAIRRTWGSGENLGNYSSIRMKLFFLTDFDEKLSTNIRLEDNLFHDIIQVELPPQYTLVTYRVLSLFEWSFRFCRRAKFLFKTDDDIFINLILLLKFISSRLDKPTNNSFLIPDMTMYGYKHYRPGVFRQANDPVGARYVITLDEFPCSHYPDFLSGFGYVMPKKGRDAIIYAAYRNTDKPFRISDVYLTGILPDYLSIERQPLPNYNIRYQGSCENFFENPTSFACAVGLHHGDSTDVFDKFNRYWQYVKKSL
ncbi:unnamed protein product [Rotaria socialis]|uniref:Hexosyltransferase n=1 Tax=Rotaria socialis TaxID=392032 RepID=A0A817LJA0_9BILA|nr:unnamed protein product [Rotaria socialis]CAF3418043.1 unnamed protein product [Rotaria socialis]CAF3526278.1 unnamed protein product [Rotaria socialis]CAF3812142.1 unnamed protein product [Rotaria socialis]CAF4238231.1 unnamed protein product [Rotaria socialis]